MLYFGIRQLISRSKPGFGTPALAGNSVCFSLQPQYNSSFFSLKLSTERQSGHLQQIKPILVRRTQEFSLQFQLQVLMTPSSSGRMKDYYIAVLIY